jgi:uroporphyrinogen-III synthase
MHVLITRPLETSAPLIEKLLSLGIMVTHFPVITFKATTQQQAFHQAIATLPHYHIAVFVSQAAVHFTLPHILATWPELPSITFTAIGPSTKKALNDYGVLSVTIPENPPFESETLLKMPTFQAVSDQKILIFRGNGGRDLLKNTLETRGAAVQYIEAYERIQPSPPSEATINAWRHAPFDAIVLSSLDCLKHLLCLIGPDSAWLKECPTVIVGLRMFEVANKLGLKRLFIAKGADDASIVQVLTTLKG